MNQALKLNSGWWNNVDINFDKYAAEKRNKHIGDEAVNGALLGGATGALQGVREYRSLIDKDVAAAVETSKVTFPAMMKAKDQAEILQNTDMFDIKPINTFSEAPQAGQEHLKALSEIQLNMGKLVEKFPGLTVVEAKYKPDIIKKILTEVKNSEPIREKIFRMLQVVGRPAAIGAALGMATPLVGHIISNTVMGSDEKKAELIEELSKQASEYIVDSIVQEMEKRAAYEVIKPLLGDIVVGSLIEKYMK